MFRLKYTIFIFFGLTLITKAEESSVYTTVKGEMTCISSNGVPGHEIGKFPNRANPNKFQEQKLTFCFPSVPRLTTKIKWGLMTVGVSTSGIPIRPYTAEYYDPNAKRGYSKNSSSGWRKQAMYDPRSLGIDIHNGHVDKSGLYHYHSVSKILDASKKDALLGYAPDGFKILYNPTAATSSWQLKAGNRLSPPRGNHDGQFEEDFEYQFGSGSLDQCNGMEHNNVYTYFATDTYPFFPRCFKGKVNLNFMVRN